jgi:energy-coupling factor transport system permease protein
MKHDRVAAASSWVRAVDVRAQLIVYICVTTGVLVLPEWKSVALFSVFLAALAVFSGVTWYETRRAWYWLFTYVVIFAVLHLVMRKGIDYILLNAFKLLGMFLPSIVIARTTDPRTYGIALHGLGLPDKWAFTLELTMRYIPLLIRDFEDTKDAQRARGLELEHPRGGFIGKVRRLAPLLIPVLARSLVESKDVANAMDMREFGALRHRTWLRRLQWRTTDSMVTVFGTAVLASCIAF